MMPLYTANVLKGAITHQASVKTESLPALYILFIHFIILFYFFINIYCIQCLHGEILLVIITCGTVSSHRARSGLYAGGFDHST